MIAKHSRRPRVLLLGGTTEASAIAQALADDEDFEIVLSFAGRTATPAAPRVAVRIGGFGGIEGLRRFLDAESINAVVDATHPFAAQISANAVTACHDTGVPLLAVERLPWVTGPGDRWTRFTNVTEAIRAIGAKPMRVFSGLGRLSLSALSETPQHRFIARVIDAPPSHAEGYNHSNVFIVTGRGPFSVDDEVELFRNHRIELVLSKNSGGEGAYGKIAAARRLGIEVFMIDRPALPKRHTVATAGEAIEWLHAHASPRTKRGV